MWPKATLINIFLFCSYAASAVALPIHSQAILHDSAMLEARSGSISTQNYLPVPHVFGCGISQPTIKAANAGHGRRQRAQGLAKQIQTPQAKTHKASTHPAGRITRKGYSRTGIFIVKAMLYSAILCCVVEMSLTVTRWSVSPQEQPF